MIGTSVYAVDDCETEFACCGQFQTRWLHTPAEVYENDLGVFPAIAVETLATTHDFNERGLLLLRSGACLNPNRPLANVRDAELHDQSVRVEVDFDPNPSGAINGTFPYSILSTPPDWNDVPVDVTVDFNY